jgi:hypothetical protein
MSRYKEEDFHRIFREQKQKECLTKAEFKETKRSLPTFMTHERSHKNEKS